MEPCHIWLGAKETCLVSCSFSWKFIKWSNSLRFEIRNKLKKAMSGMADSALKDLAEVSIRGNPT